MSRRGTNLILLALVSVLALSGLLGWVLPEPSAAPLYALHRAAGVGLIVALGWKYGIARSSLRRRLGRPRRDYSVVAGLLAGLALLGSVGLGLAWTLQLVSFDAFWGYSPLNVHVQLGLALLPIMAWHLLRRWGRRTDVRDLVGRRGALRLVGLTAATVLGWRLVESAADALASDGSRRASGSKHAGSFSANQFPVTIWLFDQVPLLDRESWRLEVVGQVARAGSFSYTDLQALPSHDLAAVLDCTGGWWSEQIWSGVRVGDVLAARGVDPAATTAVVTSITGHRWTFPLDELRRDCLLATHVGGEPLTAGHGYPVRLVAPGRRGFQWVKWVTQIEVA